MAIPRNVDEDAYSFYKYRETDETHIFKGRFTPTNCTANRLSICKKFDRTGDDAVQIKICLNENEARLYAARLGRSVCGICVSDLYATYR